MLPNAEVRSQAFSGHKPELNCACVSRGEHELALSLATPLSSQRNKQRPPSKEVKLSLTASGSQRALPGEAGQCVFHEAQLEADGVRCRLPGPHSLRAFLGRQPLCGMGVLSVIEITSRPPMVRPLMADWKGQEEQEDGTDQRRCPGVQTGLGQG